MLDVGRGAKAGRTGIKRHIIKAGANIAPYKQDLEVQMEDRFSWNGYSVKVWLFKNKDSLKLIVAGGLGLLASAVSSLPAKWSAPLGVIVAAGSKMAFDALDYWQSP